MDLPEDALKQLKKWKKLGFEPHYVEVCGQVILFRALTKEEFTEATDVHLDAGEDLLGQLYTGQYEEIIEMALLWPNPLPEDLPAATDRFLAQAIIEASSWVSTDRLVVGLEEARERASSLEGFLKSRIHSAFPTMDPHKIDKLTFNEMMYFVAQSEIITGVPVDVQPWVDPEGYQKRMEREARMARNDQRQREMGINPDPRMRDPEFRSKLIEMARDSRGKLREKTSEELDFGKMNEELNAAKNG